MAFKIPIVYTILQQDIQHKHKRQQNNSEKYIY